MSSIKDLSKDISIYAIGNIAQRAVIFILLPLYTNVLSMSEYGLVETIAVTIQILIFFMDIGMSRSVLRYYSRYQDDPSQLGHLTTTGLILMLFSGISTLAVGILFQKSLSNILFGDPKYSTVLIWTLISSFLQTVNLWIVILYRAKRQAGRYVLVSILNLVMLTALTFYFVRYLRLGVFGVLYAQCIVYLLIDTALLAGTLNLRRGQIGFSWGLARQLFNFGFPLIFTMAGMLAMNSIDRFFLVHFRGFEDVAIYSLGVRIAAMLGMLTVTPFQLAWGPFLFSKEKQDMSKFASRFFTYLIFILTFGGTIFLFFSKELVLLLSSENYLDSQGVVVFMLVSIALMGVYYWAGGLVNLVEKTWKLGFIVIFAAISNVTLNYILTPKFGWVGAAWSDVLATGIAAGLTFSIAIKNYHISFENRRILIIGLFIFCSWSFYFLTQNTIVGWASVGMRVIALLVGLLLFIPMHFITDYEYKKVRGMITSIKTRYS
ncbi:MAG TPA: oligosaccharide flippase family protein [Anaerolineales bacterium]|nr:oligosaccharide flippase family protein [Anaerolineales bacterium]